MLSACDAILKPNCLHYQVHATAALKIGPGAREQVLHREEDPYQFFKVPRPRMILASMWAITDFTAANGGTKIVPGSHLWPADRVARPDEVVAAEMPAGSVLLWMGGTLHGAGANRTDEWRYGVFLSYSLGWLRQEENQYIDVPRRGRAHAFKGGARAGRLQDAHGNRLLRRTGERPPRREALMAKDSISRAAGDRRADARLRPGVVGRLGAAAGLSQFDLRVSESGSGRARVWNRARKNPAARRRSSRPDLCAPEPSQRRNPRGAAGAARARRQLGGDLQFRAWLRSSP